MSFVLILNGSSTSGRRDLKISRDLNKVNLNIWLYNNKNSAIIWE